MKATKIIVTLSLLAIFSLTAIAQEKNSLKFYVYSTVKIAGTQLEPGRYKLQWTGSGPDITASIVQNHKTLVTVPGRIVSDTSPHSGVALILKDGDRLSGLLTKTMRVDLGDTPVTATR